MEVILEDNPREHPGEYSLENTLEVTFRRHPHWRKFLGGQTLKTPFVLDTMEDT
jgi:hypothetical protein